MTWFASTPNPQFGIFSQSLLQEPAQTRLQTTFLQVSQVRRGPTQRDYRLVYYKFSRFSENPELYPKIFFALRAAWSTEYIYSTYTVKNLSALRAAWSTECYAQNHPPPAIVTSLQTTILQISRILKFGLLLN